MPYQSDTYKFKLPLEHDKRVKITPVLRAEILQLNKAGVSTREIARRFEGIASRRSIQFIINPERRIDNLRARHLRLLSEPQKYYDRESHTLAVRKHRKHKREVMDKIGAAQQLDQARRHNFVPPKWEKEQLYPPFKKNDQE